VTDITGTSHSEAYPSAKGTRAMIDAITRSQEEENLLSYDVSDEAIEAAAKKCAAANYTLAACTGLSVCPG
jgi:hypothetical protein